jgi:hypothetical protein
LTAEWTAAGELVRDQAEERERAAIVADGCDGDPNAPPALARAAKRLPRVALAGAARRQPLSVAAEIERWRADGPLVHEATGLSSIDEALGGGPVYGSRGYILGEPDAGKTALLVQLGHTWACRGLAVGILAADEESADVMTRLAQRAGIERFQCERRSPDDLAAIHHELGALPLYVYDETWTIDDAGADLARRPAPGRALLVDSIQTVTCDDEHKTDRELQLPAAIRLRARALRRVAVEHRMIAIATSEVTRARYAPRRREDRTDALAGGAWSSSIEYAARYVLSLGSVEGQDDLIEVEVPKNKLGRRRRGDEAIYLRIERRTQTIAEDDYKPADANDRKIQRGAARAERVLADAAAAAVVIAGRPGIGTTALRAAVRGVLACGATRADVAVNAIRHGLVRREGVGRSVLHYIDGPALDPALVAAVPLSDRPHVVAARAPRSASASSVSEADARFSDDGAAA